VIALTLYDKTPVFLQCVLMVNITCRWTAYRRGSALTCTLDFRVAAFYRAAACNATHGIVTRKLSFRPSVRLSIKRVDYDKTKETCASILIPHGRPHPSFLTRRMVRGGRTLLHKVLDQTDPIWAKTPIFNRY